MPTQPEALASSPEAFAETLDRFLSHVLAESWATFSVVWCAPREAPRYSGILPLGSLALLPHLEAPGVLLIFGPPPGLPLLEMVEATEPMGVALWSRIRKNPEGGYSWGSGGGRALPPDFAACINLHGQWAFTPFLRTHLLRLLQPWSQPLGDLLGCAHPH